MKVYHSKEWLEHHYLELKLSTDKMAELAECGRTAIKYWMHKRNIPMRTTSETLIISHQLGRIASTRTEVDEETQRKIIEMYGKSGFNGIRKELGVHHGVARRVLIANGVQIRTPNKDLYHFDNTVFDDLHSEEACYWLGFCYAEACVYRNALRVCLSEKDADHLRKLMAFLKTDRPLHQTKRRNSFDYEAKPTLALIVGNKYLTRKLSELGIVKDRKSLELTIAAVPEEMVRHFIRGVLDGDGSVRRREPSFRFCGGSNLLEWIREKISEEVKANPSLMSTKSEKTAALEFHGRYAGKRVAQYLYDEAIIWMDRKKEIVDSWDLPSKDFCTRPRNKKGQFISLALLLQLLLFNCLPGH